MWHLGGKKMIEFITKNGKSVILINKMFPIKKISEYFFYIANILQIENIDIIGIKKKGLIVFIVNNNKFIYKQQIVKIKKNSVEDFNKDEFVKLSKIGISLLRDVKNRLSQKRGKKEDVFIINLQEMIKGIFFEDEEIKKWMLK